MARQQQHEDEVGGREQDLLKDRIPPHRVGEQRQEFAGASAPGSTSQR
jgi:hypothetical protein